VNLLALFIIQGFILGPMFRRLKVASQRRLFGAAMGMTILYMLYGPKFLLFVAYLVVAFPFVNMRRPLLAFVVSMGALLAG